MKRAIKFTVLVMLTASLASAQAAAPAPSAADFAPFQQWMGAVLTGDAATLKSLYSTDPAAAIEVKRVNQDAAADTAYWMGLRAKTMKVQIIRLVIRPDRASVIFSADIVSGANGEKISVAEADAALNLDPDSPGVHYLRGQVFQHLGRVQDAKAEMRTFTQLSNEAREKRHR